MWLKAAILTFFVVVSAHAEFKVPWLDRAVTDLAALISDGTEAQLETALRDLNKRGRVQLAVLTVPSLEGMPIEQASIRVVDQWKLGTTAKDNGVLLLISKSDRALRIEVGQGLEGDLPDAYSKRIIDNSIVPLFKSGDFEGGILVGVRDIISHTDSEFNFDSYFQSGRVQDYPRSKSHSRAIWPDSVLGSILFALFFSKGGIWFLIFILWLFFGRRSGRRRYGGWGGGSSWGGRSGGFGGGFGGGGGGFSGGGASGRW